MVPSMAWEDPLDRADRERASKRYGVFTQEGCHACKDHKRIAKARYKDGTLVPLPLEKPENEAFADRFDIMGTPQCVELGPDGVPKRRCTPEEEERLLWGKDA